MLASFVCRTVHIAHGGGRRQHGGSRGTLVRPFAVRGWNSMLNDAWCSSMAESNMDDSTGANRTSSVDGPVIRRARITLAVFSPEFLLPRMRWALHRLSYSWRPFFGLTIRTGLPQFHLANWRRSWGGTPYTVRRRCCGSSDRQHATSTTTTSA